MESWVILALTNRADLARVQGVGGVFSDLLGQAGIDHLHGGPTASPRIYDIDSAAIYSVVPTAIPERLGIKPLAEEEFRPTDDAKVVRRKTLRSLDVMVKG